MVFSDAAIKHKQTETSALTHSGTHILKHMRLCIHTPLRCCLQHTAGGWQCLASLREDGSWAYRGFGLHGRSLQILWCQHNPGLLGNSIPGCRAAGQRRLQLRVLPGADVRHLRHLTINNPACGSCASWEQSQPLPECETLEEKENNDGR